MEASTMKREADIRDAEVIVPSLLVLPSLLLLPQSS